MGLTGKRFLVLIVLAVIVITGMGSALMARAAHSATPAATGVVFSASPLDTPRTGPVSVAGSQSAQNQITALDWQLEDAWRKGDWNRCIEVLTAILTVDVANVQARQRLYQARVNHGWLQLSHQKFEEAHKQFSLALQIQPSGQEAIEGLRLLQQLIVCPAPVGAPVSAPTPCSPVCAPLAAPTPCLSGTGRIHVVQRGDNLFRLALRFNTSVAVIMKANGLQTTTIKVGQKLVIP